MFKIEFVCQVTMVEKKYCTYIMNIQELSGPQYYYLCFFFNSTILYNKNIYKFLIFVSRRNKQNKRQLRIQDARAYLFCNPYAGSYAIFIFISCFLVLMVNMLLYSNIYRTDKCFCSNILQLVRAFCATYCISFIH